MAKFMYLNNYYEPEGVPIVEKSGAEEAVGLKLWTRPVLEYD